MSRWRLLASWPSTTADPRDRTSADLPSDPIPGHANLKRTPCDVPQARRRSHEVAGIAPSSSKLARRPWRRQLFVFYSQGTPNLFVFGLQPTQQTPSIVT